MAKDKDKLRLVYYVRSYRNFDDNFWRNVTDGQIEVSQFVDMIVDGWSAMSDFIKSLTTVSDEMWLNG